MCNNCKFKCLCNSENNCIGWSGKSPLKKVCDVSYQQGRADKAKEMIDKLYDMFAQNNGRIFLSDFDSFVKGQENGDIL